MGRPDSRTPSEASQVRYPTFSFRRRLLIKIRQNPNDQIGCVYLFDLFQRLLWDEITFHSSASVSAFFSTAGQDVPPRARFIHDTSNTIPIKGIRTHAGRLFNS
jgi:hypothetical protein